MTLVPGATVNVLYRGNRWDGEGDVQIPNAPFCIDSYEASQPDATATAIGSWQEQAKPPPATSRRGVLPWTSVSWENARAACESAGKRLPTLAEWQMAFSGASGDLWPWGNTLKANRCNVANPSGPRPTGACCFTICEDWCYNVCDMVGNVSEWVSDYWDRDCYGETQVSIAGGAYGNEYFFPHTDVPNGNIQRPDPARPGCWVMSNYGLDRSGLHAHARSFGAPDDGFRCAKSVNAE